MTHRGRINARKTRQEEKSLPPQGVLTSKTSDTASDQTPLHRDNNISQIASSSKLCISIPKETQVQLLMHELFL